MNKSTSSWRILLTNTLWGIGFGLRIAFVFTILATVGFGLAGGSFGPRYASFGQMLGIYMIGGVSGGAIVGVLRPLVKFRWGAVVVGILGAFPVYIGVALSLDHFQPLTMLDVYIAIFAAIICGTGAGLIIWEVQQRRPATTGR